MLADIATGHHAGADVCFLIAVILAAIAALLVVAPRRRTRDTNGPAVDYYVWAPLFGWAAVAVVALAWLLL